MEFIIKILKTYAYVSAGITISAALFITIFIPQQKLHVSLLWEIIAMAGVCSLGNLIYYIKNALTKKQMMVRIVCHYIFINLVVMGGALLWGWITPGLIPEFLVMLLLIAAVYVIVMIANFRQEVKVAENLNRQLRKYYPEQEEGENS